MTHSPLQPQLEESSLLNKINRSNPKSWILYRNPNVTAHGLCLLSWELVGRAGELCCVWASCCRAKASSACGASPAVTFALMTSSWVPGCYICVLFWFLLCVSVLVGCVGFFLCLWGFLFCPWLLFLLQGNRNYPLKSKDREPSSPDHPVLLSPVPH